MQEYQEELTAAQLTVLNYLKSLDGGRTTFRRMATFTGYSERDCKGYVKQLREKNYWIVSNKNKDQLGTFITDNPGIWKEYLDRRFKESQSIVESLTKM